MYIMSERIHSNWMLTFPDRENAGNLVNLIFYTGKLWQHRENFENLELLENVDI